VGFGQIERGDAGLLRPYDDLVVDVGEVTHEGDVVADETQVPEQHVEGDQRTCVTDVRAIVDGDAADVDAGLAGNQRHELFEPAAQCIVKAKGHGIQKGC